MHCVGAIVPAGFREGLLMRIQGMVLLVSLFSAAAVAADTIELEGGDKLEVEIIEDGETTIVAEHPVLGRITIPKSALKPPAPEEPGLFGSSILRGWKRSLGVGLSGSSGNSSDASFNTSLKIGREAESYRGNFSTSYFYASKQGEQTTNQFFGDYQHDFLFSGSRFFLFGKGRYDYDAFQSWVNRISASAGAGYEFVNREKFELRGNLGVGFARIWGVEPRWKPEGVAAVALEWRIVEGQSFAADTTYYPNFDDLPEFRLISNANYNIGIGPIAGLSLKFGLKNE